MAMAVTYTNFCGRIVAENRGGVQRSYVRDTLGNTVALLDSNQNTTDSWKYWPYGEVANRTGTNPTPLQYGGTLGYYTGILSQIYIRARILEAILARWLTVDPIWPSEKAYQYAKSSPAKYTDPSGTKPAPSCVVAAPPPPCPPCSALIKPIDDTSGVASLLNCITKNGGTMSGLRECLAAASGSVSTAAFKALAPYLACMEASSTALGKKGCNACLSSGSDAQNCCFQKFLTAVFNCMGSYGVSGYILCITGKENDFKECAAVTAFDDDKR